MQLSRSQQGFNLIEVMVALVVLSIGLLGLAGLQVLGLKYNHQSYERTQATILINDIIDRMRANPDAASAGTYVSAAPTTAPTTYSGCFSPGSYCTSAQVAAYDLNEWRGAIAAQRMLPQGSGAISRNGTLYSVTIRWIENDLTMEQTQDVQI